MNIQSLLKQAKNMQKELNKLEAELKEKTYSTSVGGGAVKVTVGGDNKVVDLSIEESLLDKENKEELQDMIVMAINEALSKMSKDKEDTMGAITNGIKMPGVF